jgi:heme exporter protein B
MAKQRKPAVQTSFWKAMWAVVWKDVSAEWRSREMVSSMLIFSLLVAFIFNFSLDLNPQIQRDITGGMLWVTFAFAGTLGLNRSMAIEKDRACLDGLLLAPVERSAIYFGKVIGNLVFMFMVEIIVLPLFSIFYNVNLFNLGLIGVIVLGSVGYVVVGTLISTMTVQTRTRDILLPILTFPVVLPVIASAVRASTFFLQGQSMDLIWPNINLLIAFDVIYIAIAYMVFDFIVEE